MDISGAIAQKAKQASDTGPTCETRRPIPAKRADCCARDYRARLVVPLLRFHEGMARSWVRRKSPHKCMIFSKDRCES